MTAYMIADLRLHDPIAYEAYKANVPALIARHGGEYLVRGGACEILEGRWQPDRLVLLRFPSRPALQAFFDDPDYAPFKALRQRISDADIVLVEGIEQPTSGRPAQ